MSRGSVSLIGRSSNTYSSPWHHSAVSQLLGAVADFPPSPATTTRTHHQTSWQPGDPPPDRRNYDYVPGGGHPQQYMDDMAKFTNHHKTQKKDDVLSSKL